jgi:hypothetical protein
MPDRTSDPNASPCGTRATDEGAVHAAIMSGRTDARAPGPRQRKMTVYDGAFVQEPDGNKVETATFPRKS